LLDWSFAAIPTFDERFARQYRYDLPPDFRLASAYAGIDRNLSGPNIVATAHSVPKGRTADSAASASYPKLLSLHLKIFSRVKTAGLICDCVRLLGPCYKTGNAANIEAKV